MQKNKMIDSWRWRIAKAGHTVKSFASATGRNKNQIYNWLNGWANPSAKSIEAMEKDLKDMGV